MKFRVDAFAHGLISGRAAREWPAAERSLAAAWRREPPPRRCAAGSGREGRAVHREDGLFAFNFGAEILNEVVRNVGAGCQEVEAQRVGIGPRRGRGER